MSETGKLINQTQDTAIWQNLDKLAQLPGWLVTARSAEEVRRRLLYTLPEFSSGQLLLQQVEVGHIRYKDDFWSGLYELHIQKPDNGASESELITLQGYIYPPDRMSTRKPLLRGELGTDDWRAVFPDLCLELRGQEEETTLDALQDLTHAELSRQFLTRHIRAHSPNYADYLIGSCVPKVVRYKPGSRCTIVYYLEYDPDLEQGRGWPRMVVGKTYKSDKGQTAYDGMLALWNSPLGTSKVVKVAEPLAYIPERRVLIQGSIREEITLKEMMVSAIRSGDAQSLDRLDTFVRKSAAGLAELHRSKVGMGRVWSWEDEANAVRDEIEGLTSALPELSGSVEPLLERLKEIEAATLPDALVPSHGSFRPAQVLISGDEIGFIDFDSFCQSEPANDIALFLSAVMSLGMIADFDDSSISLDETARPKRYELVNSISESFLQEYERYLPLSRRRVALWETLDILMLVLHSWAKIKKGESPDIYYLLEQFIQNNKIVEGR